MQNNEQTGLTPQKERYSPQLTQQVRRAAVKDVLTAQTDLLQKACTKVNLKDTAEVRRVTQEFMQTCSGVGIVPTLEGLCARLGLSRVYVYRYIKENPEDETAQYLNQVRLLWAQARMGLAERGLLDNAMSIFILKNSGLGMADKHEIEMDVEQKQDRPDWAVGMSNERYKQELLKNIDMYGDMDE